MAVEEITQPAQAQYGAVPTANTNGNNSDDRDAQGSIVFEQYFPTLNATDRELSMHIFHLELPHCFDLLLQVFGLWLSLFWTVPGIFVPLVVAAVTGDTNMDGFTGIAAACIVLSSFQTLAYLHGFGSVAEHSWAVIFYTLAIGWAAGEYTVKGSFLPFPPSVSAVSDLLPDLTPGRGHRLGGGLFYRGVVWTLFSRSPASQMGVSQARTPLPTATPPP